MTEKLNVRHIYRIISYKKKDDMHYHMHKASRIGKCYTCKYDTSCPYSNDQYNYCIDMICIRYIPKDYLIGTNVHIFSTTETYNFYYIFARGVTYD